MVGAGCSIVAAGISLGLDVFNLAKKTNTTNAEEQMAFRGLYYSKILSDIAILVSAEGKLMSALISRFGWDTTRGTMGLWLGWAAAPRLVFLGVEWIGLLSSWWFALVIMVSEYIITEYFSRNDLQNWYEQGIFGNENTLNSDGLKSEKMTHLIAKSQNDLMNCLRTMSSPQHKKEVPRQEFFWPFIIQTEQEDYIA